VSARLEPTGIIDIGSNSVRFVAYGGNARVPSHLFNEKISPELGRGLDRDGKLARQSMDRALGALIRFRQLARDMGLKRLTTVATAAVRDAANGADFLDQVRSTGLDPILLSGEEEAELAAFGVISSIPGARGISADLGGGSLELTNIADGAVGERVSLPIGVLRLEPDRDAQRIRATIRKALNQWRVPDSRKAQNLYLVGGSFRAIGRLDLQATAHPLPITHQHQLTRERLAALSAYVAASSPDEVKQMSGLSSNRVEALPAAMSVLQGLIEVIEPAAVVVSTFGLREGMLFRDLDAATRAQDPLLAAALEVGERLGRFGDHGATIDEWIDPLFPDDDSQSRRLRLAACLMCDFGWNAHPDFRADRAVDMALHGNWVGIDAHGRAVLGRTLSAAFASEKGLATELTALLGDGEERRAIAWGRGIRLAQRLSGGTEAALLRSSIGVEGREVVLRVPRNQHALIGEIVAKRLTQLAKLLGRDARVDLA
jgi:exopolyphosphatase / guanosine-5'-triphosphate,3'-diphosphate pyrophosphatase